VPEDADIAAISLPSSFYRKDEALPPPIRYYDGNPPAVMKFGTAWQGANFEVVEKTSEIAPGITLIALVSDAPGTKELRELSLAINTPDDMVRIVGCSHPGVEKNVEAAASLSRRRLAARTGARIGQDRLRACEWDMLVPPADGC
jgi:7,8-dihydropterin-6-yl-methyl-4-(beta-D-ribofuranosyl)aminobenzene 5'-phosphate synthase